MLLAICHGFMFPDRQMIQCELQSGHIAWAVVIAATDFICVACQHCIRMWGTFSGRIVMTNALRWLNRIHVIRQMDVRAQKAAMELRTFLPWSLHTCELYAFFHCRSSRSTGKSIAKGARLITHVCEIWWLQMVSVRKLMNEMNVYFIWKWF